MRTLLALLFALTWFVGQPSRLYAREGAQEASFKPAEVVSVSDLTIPINSVAFGTTVLDVTVSKEGEVKGIQVRRNVPSETEEAVRSVKTWKFAPARFNGRPVVSRATVAVTFNPAPPLADNIPLPPLIYQSHETLPDIAYDPPEVVHAMFPGYPLKARQPATVVLEVTLDPAGEAQGNKVLRDAPPFTTTAIQAIREWRFAPATLGGKPVASKIFLVFCFRHPDSSWP